MHSLAFANAGAQVASSNAQLRGPRLASNDGLPPQSAYSYGGAATWLLGATTAAAATATAMTSGLKSRQRPAHTHRVACRADAMAIDTSMEPPPAPPPFDPAGQIGITQPLGYFDPLGFCKVGDERGFHKLRSSEIKHGRVAMLAAIGAVFQHYVHFPGCEDVPNGLRAILDPIGILAELFLVPIVGFLELIYWKDDLSKEPGNFGDPAGWADTGLGGAGSYSDDMRNKELNNGRAAMFSIIGIIVAELATGKDAIQQFGLP
eukprot:TRINITY_DN2287_c0_g1_i2.p1 TRINITY_DN2287_c0_g1~~TRINITY_DN2287_c0_g1_i2.p1  ORF type:complete len:262 (-),score=50.99 TRINITY_DN2287_c0_g1_i2:240-1025(-)